MRMKPGNTESERCVYSTQKIPIENGLSAPMWHGGPLPFMSTLKETKKSDKKTPLNHPLKSNSSYPPNFNQCTTSNARCTTINPIKAKIERQKKHRFTRVQPLSNLDSFTLLDLVSLFTIKKGTKKVNQIQYTSDCNLCIERCTIA